MAWKFFTSAGAQKTSSSSLTPVYGTSLPGSPFDGQEAVLVDSVTSPTYQWRFRYNAGSSNGDKWEFVGGIGGYNQVLTSETTASTTYAALATAGPSFTIPRAGIYIVEIGCEMGQFGSNTRFMSYDIGGTGAVDADGIKAIFGASPADNLVTFANARQKTIAAGATALVAKYKTSSGTPPFANRWMRVIPVRVS